MREEGSYVLDADDRVVGVRGGLEERLGCFLARSFWEASPAAEELFRPHFEEARRTQREVEFTAYYAGTLARRRVVPSGETLTVYVTPLLELDVRTLTTLAESLQRIEAALAAPAPARPAPPARASLQAPP
ncbi:MAG TPA: hypothetical protein VNK94_08855 [Gaiellaceae bacterium]|nr:hypothetical protein [Gaiellaceae bacterium]